VGEKHNHSFQLSFNPSLKVDFQGSRVTSEGDKNGWEGRGQQLGTLIGTVRTLSGALSPAKENNYALESLDGYIVRGCWARAPFRAVGD
jgi:hypothetical protein